MRRVLAVVALTAGLLFAVPAAQAATVHKPICGGNPPVDITYHESYILRHKHYVPSGWFWEAQSGVFWEVLCPPESGHLYVGIQRRACSLRPSPHCIWNTIESAPVKNLAGLHAGEEWKSNIPDALCTGFVKWRIRVAWLGKNDRGERDSGLIYLASRRLFCFGATAAPILTSAVVPDTASWSLYENGDAGSGTPYGYVNAAVIGEQSFIITADEGDTFSLEREQDVGGIDYWQFEDNVTGACLEDFTTLGDAVEGGTCQGGSGPGAMAQHWSFVGGEYHQVVNLYTGKFLSADPDDLVNTSGGLVNGDVIEWLISK